MVLGINFDKFLQKIDMVFFKKKRYGRAVELDTNN